MQAWLEIVAALAARAGRGRADPGGRRGGDRGDRGRRRLRPRRGRRGHARVGPLDARDHPRVAAAPVAGGERVDLLGRDRAGRHGHVDGHGHARRPRRRRRRARAARGARSPRSRASTARPSCSGARTGSPACRSRSASRPPSGSRRCAATASGSRRRGRASPSASSPGRSARARSGASTGSSCSAGCARALGLAAPDITWLTARDRVAEFLTLLALVTGTLAKIGREVYELQRPEIGELAEATRPGLVGSITMPHKRNPELSEHLGTLWRVVRGGGRRSRSRGSCTSTSATARRGRPSGRTCRRRAS